MKISLALITLLTLFALISCNPAGKNTEKSQQTPVTSKSLDQSGFTNTDPGLPAENKTAEQTVLLQDEAEVMLNPPHGQPYHRCDIPVGAPLSSPPANASGQTTNNQVQSAAPNPANNPTAPTVENASRLNPSQARTTTSATNEGKPRLNPPHGQPFHRCDIPVGSPLP